MNLTSAQFGTVAIVYLASVVPAIVLLYLYTAKKLPKWLFAVYLSSCFNGADTGAVPG